MLNLLLQLLSSSVENIQPSWQFSCSNSPGFPTMHCNPALNKRFSNTALQMQQHNRNTQRNNLQFLHETVTVHIRGVNILGANILGANILGANILGANILGVNILGVNILRVNILRRTLPLSYMLPFLPLHLPPCTQTAPVHRPE